MGYIYKITNEINKKIYIGQSKNPIKYRWQHHQWKAKHPEKQETDYPLYRSMRKYGLENFSIALIEEIEDSLLNEREKHWIMKFDCIAPKGYNCCEGGAGASKFNHEEILQYFLNEGKENASETARKFNCSLVTVLKILDTNNLSGRGKFQPVYQIDIHTGKILNQFNSLVEAREFCKIGRTQLWSAVNGQAKTAGGFAWCKIQDLDDFDIEEHLDKKKLKIICLENNYQFESLKAAAEWVIEKKLTTAKNPQYVGPNISNAIKKNITSYGYHWTKSI